MSISNYVGPLTREPFASFQENRFLAIDRIVPLEDLEPIEIECAELLEPVARWPHRDRKIYDTCDSLPFGQCHSHIFFVFPDLHRSRDTSLPLLNDEIDAETSCMHADPAVFDSMRHTKTKDDVKAIIGGKIHSSPVQQMRTKAPALTFKGRLADHSNAGATSRHRDMAPPLAEAGDSEQLTIWLAITEAAVEDAWLTSIPGPRREEPKVHCSELAIESEPQVPDGVVQDRYSKPVPAKKCGAVSFHRMNVRRTLAILPDGPKWSMDPGYHPIGQPTARPAFPGFVARSGTNPQSERTDPGTWAESWNEARKGIVSGDFRGYLFEDTRWSNAAIC